MAIALGPLSLLDIAIPTGVDGSELARFKMEQGLSDQEAITLATQIIGQVNQDLVDLYGGMIYFTRNDHAVYRQGSGTVSMTPLVGEFVNPDPIRGNMIGHMFSRKDFRDGVEMSDMFMKRGDPTRFIAAIQEVADRWRNRVDFDILTRALSNTEIPIGSAGYDVPWAIGTGTNVNYIPPEYYGKTFTSSHTHFNFANSSAGGTWATLLTAMAQNLREHGFTQTLTALVSQTDAVTIASLSNFARLIPGTLQINSGNTSAPVFTAGGVVTGVPGSLIGWYIDPTAGMVEIRYHPRIPTGYAFMFGSYGIGDARNPIAVRVDPEGFGMTVKPRLEPSFDRRVEALRFDSVYGVSTNDRVAGVAGFLGAGAVSYVLPTIT